MKRFLCPRHKEETPSCIAYETHAYCFGCNEKIPLEEIGIKGVGSKKPRYVENIAESVARIQTLPSREIRGLSLPFDNSGFYILWPEKDYYKFRAWDDREPRYLGPVGHTAPLLRSLQGHGRELYLVEGELNALSVGRCWSRLAGNAARTIGHDSSVASPGSASNFTKDYNLKYLQEYKNYDKIVLVLDKDPAGVQGAINMKSFLVPHIPDVSIVLMEKDANQVLVEDGEEALAKILKENRL